MATSKLPVDFFCLPNEVVDLLLRAPRVYVNLRPNQYSVEPRGEYDGIFVFPAVRDFLKIISVPTKVAILFQGYSADAVGTAVVELHPINCWADGDYPRLDFEHPPEMKRLHGCPNFWGAFILAITPVCGTQTLPFCVEDRNFETFLKLLGLKPPF